MACFWLYSLVRAVFNITEVSKIPGGGNMKLSKLVIAAMMMTMVVGGKAFAEDPNLNPKGCPLTGHVLTSAPTRDNFQRVAAQDEGQVQSQSKRKVSDRY